MVDGQGEEQQVEAAVEKLRDERFRLALADAQVELRMARSERGQKRRQGIGGNGGNDAEMQRAGERACALAGEIGKVAHLGEDAPGALRHLPALGGELDGLVPALDQCHAELPLELADLHGQGRLRDRAMVRRPPEMIEARHRLEIAKLSEGHHGHQFILSSAQGNTIGPDV